MASKTENVKLGVCKITFGGVDLGYTKGGVEVDVTTNTHAVTVDQFGESVVNEYITKRDIKIKAPLAETTLDNLVTVMPGATLISDGAKASGTINFGAVNAVANDTITVNGVAFTFKVSPTLETDIGIGANVAATIGLVTKALNASTNVAVTSTLFSDDGVSTVTGTSKSYGIDGNAYSLAASVATVSGATMTGGITPTTQRVDVTNGVGTNLLTTAKPLLLHPIDLVETDQSEDLFVPLAATGGAMNFAYKHDAERVYNVDFSGYPDPITEILFKLGDRTAV